MKIKSIRIEFEPTDPNDPLQSALAEVGTFEHGLWNADGPMFSRINSSLHEIWKILRNTAAGNL
jgi:hypothetical protein